jgi:glyoxylase-like metal-dependent hydrolase (beta-lactamase superfamily II)
MTEDFNSTTMVEIPSSDSTVDVSIIDTTLRFNHWSVEPFIEKRVNGHTHFSAPSYSFKITHPTQGIILFDLGLRLDWQEHLPPPSKQLIKENNWTFKLEKDVAEILQENGETLESVKAIIWSHFHWDHTGDPSKFPTSTQLVVGPGFKETYLPGYPDDPDGKVMSDAFKGRELKEIVFSDDGKLEIAGYPAFDYFGDGSFYLLDTPGHTVGHICGLARVTAEPTFIFMGGDIAHFVGQFRPSSHKPLPDPIVPDPRESPRISLSSSCPCAIYLKIHPSQSNSKPYYRGNPGMAFDRKLAEQSTQKLEALDADSRVLVVIAHDNTLEEVINVYPKTASSWKENSWKDRVVWRFLKDFTPDTGHE